MHYNFRVVFLSGLAVLSGVVLFLFKQNYIILNLPKSWEDLRGDKAYNREIFRKEVNLYAYKVNKLYSDGASIVWRKEVAEDLKTLINSWLIFVHDEQETPLRASINTVALSQSGQDAYLSFDSNILMSEWPVIKKWKFIEGLLKTIRESSQGIRFIFFLVKDKRLKDEHLDFSRSWPIDGFISS